MKIRLTLKKMLAAGSSTAALALSLVPTVHAETIIGDQEQDSISIIGQIPYYVPGSQTATTGDITLSSSVVMVYGNQSATLGNITLDDSSGLQVLGTQMAGQDITIGKDCTNIVEMNQEAGGDIITNGSNSVTGNQKAGNDIIIHGSNSVTGKQEANNIIVKSSGDNTVGGDQLAENGSISISSKNEVTGTQKAGAITIDRGANTVKTGDQIATTGNIELSGVSGASNVVTKGSQIAEKGNIIQTMGSNKVAGNQEATEGYIQMNGGELTVGGAQTAGQDIIMSIGKTEDGVALALNATVGSQYAKEDIYLTGSGQFNDLTLTVNKGQKAEGDIVITNVGNPNVTSIALNSVTIKEGGMSAGGNITISNEGKTVSEASGNTVVIESGDMTAAGVLTLNNAKISVTNGAVSIGKTADITGSMLTVSEDLTFSGDTTISGSTVESETGNINFSGASLTLTNSTLSATAGTIYVDSQTTLNISSDVTLVGTFEYTPSSGNEGDEDGSAPTIGLGAQGDHSYTLDSDSLSNLGATVTVNAENLILANSRLDEDSTLVTTQASGSIEIVTQTDGTISYTMGSLNTSSANTEGENTGIILANNTAKAGDVTIYEGDVIKNEHTTQRIDVSATQAADGSTRIVTDTVVVKGNLDAGGARVSLESPVVSMALDDETVDYKLSSGDFVAVDQTESRIVSVEGEVISGYNEDIKYGEELVNGVTQRTLQGMNAWVRTDADGASIVYSQNYRSAEGKSANQQAVANVLQEASLLHGQADGERAASSSRFENMLDAFDFTRSADAAKRGLTSVSGVSTTIAQHAVMDSSRHHMDTLRRWISLPECPAKSAVPTPVTVEADGKAPRTMAAAPVVTENPASSVWMTYTGGHDMIDDPAHEMGGYTRSSHGALMGYSRSMGCNLLLGLGLGYENSISRSDITRHDADSVFVDLYGAARTGRFNHRFSAGVGMHDFDAKRGVFVAAPGHDFAGTATSNFRARSLNLGYELSTDVALSQRAALTPFIALNYAHHSFNKVKECGLGDAGLITRLESIDQLEAALGARYAYSFGLVKEQAPATFSASAELKAEFSDHAPNAYSHFIGHENASFRTESLERSPIYAEIGAGLKVPFATQWTGSVSTSYEFGSDRNAINVGAGVNYSF